MLGLWSELHSGFRPDEYGCKADIQYTKHTQRMIWDVDKHTLSPLRSIKICMTICFSGRLGFFLAARMPYAECCQRG